MDDNCDTIDAGKIEQMAIWYGPFSVLLLVNTLVIVIIIGVLVSRTVRDRYKKCSLSDPAHAPLLRFGPTSVNDYNNNKNEQQKQLLKLSLPLLAYPIVYQILSFFAFADRLYRIVNNNQDCGMPMHLPVLAEGSLQVSPSSSISA